MLVKLRQAKLKGDEYSDRHNDHSEHIHFDVEDYYVNTDKVTGVSPFSYPEVYLTERTKKEVGTEFTKVQTDMGVVIVVGNPQKIAELLNVTGKQVLKG